MKLFAKYTLCLLLGHRYYADYETLPPDFGKIERWIWLGRCERCGKEYNE